MIPVGKLRYSHGVYNEGTKVEVLAWLEGKTHQWAMCRMPDNRVEPIQHDYLLVTGYISRETLTVR